MKPFMFTVLVVILNWTVPARGQLQEIDSPANEIVVLGFEEGELGSMPAGWIVPVEGWSAELTDVDASSGTRSVRLRLTGATEAPFGNVMRMVDAAEYRNRKLRLSAKIRVQGPNARAQMWLRVDRPNQKSGFFDNMGDRPLTQDRWVNAVIEGDIDADAQQLAIGVIAFTGKVLIDDMKLEAIGEVKHQAPSPAQALTKRGLDNIEAATRLLAYIRLFHPSDEAVESKNWDHLAVKLMENVEPAETAADLAERLQTFFVPLAPTVAVWAGPTDQAPTPTIVPSDATTLRYWRHRGAGVVTQSIGPGIYRSQVESMPLEDGSRGKTNVDSLWNSLKDLVKGKDASHPPSQAFVVTELGGGVCCRVPLLVLANNEGTLPVASGPTMQGDDALPRLTARNRATRLAAVATAWGVMQHFYPYFDVVDSDWDAALTRALRRAAEDKNEIEFLHTLQSLIAELHDGHGMVYHPAFASGRILPVSFIWANDELVVGGKTGSAGDQIEIGDVLVAVEGESIANYLERLSTRISAATSGWRKSRLANMIVTNFSDVDSCTLRVRKPGGSVVDVTLAPAVPAQMVEVAMKRPENGSEVAPGIVYVDLSGLELDPFQGLLPVLESAQGIIFDLRGYPASAAVPLMQRMSGDRIKSARWNVPVITLPDRQDWNWDESNWDLPPIKPRLEAECVFLVDGRAISYAESIMGIVEHYRLGEIVGEPTAGTNGNVNPFTVPGGYIVTWTGMQVLKHDGTRHHGIGIQPTVTCEPTVEGLAARRDEVLEKGVEVLTVKQSASR